MTYLWLTLFLFSSVYAHDSLYSITAPNTFRSNVPYQLIVTIHQSPSPVDVKVSLSSIDKNIDPLHSDITINSGESEIIQLDVGSLGFGVYTLRIEGSGGIDFNKSSTVSYNSKMFSTFIQTDKAIYKPGQIVNFRVIVVDVHLKPFDTKDTSIFVIDNEGNRIRQWNNVSFNNGVFSGNLQLSDQVNLGDWQIKTIVKDLQEIKHFTIAEYVLPTFEVEVKPPSFATYNESKVVITIKAQYTYGKPVKGQVLLNISDYYCKWPCKPYNMKPLTVSTSIDGKADISVDLITDLGITDNSRYDRRFSIFASVTEELTGRQQNGSGEITIYVSKYKLFFSDVNSYKPGLKYSNTLQVSLQDGTPIMEKDQQVSVSYGDGKNWGEIWDKTKTTLNFTVPQDGEIVVEFVTPEEMDSVRLEANFKGVTTSSYASKAQSLSDKYLHLSLITTDNKVGSEVKLTIDSTNELNNQLILQVIGRGKILYWEQIEPNKLKSQEVHFKLTPDMAPKVRVIVYYATTCGEIVADSVDFSVDGIFKTKVDVQANPNSTSPGDQVDVVVSTEPNAFVGLLAVDQSVLLLKTGNDITTKDVLDDLQNYEIGLQSYYTYRNGRYCIRPWRPSSPTTSQLFSQVGLILFTNGLLIPTSSFGGYGGYGRGISTINLAGPSLMSDSAGFRRKSANVGSINPSSVMEPTRVRRNFPETFLWTDSIADNDGKMSVKTQAPDTITSFVITAFAMDTENGLGLTDSPTKLRVFRDFFVTLNLPYSVVRGEAVQLQAIVFNYLKDDVEAEVTLNNEDGNLELVEYENAVNEEDLQQKQMTKKILAKAGEGTSVSFLVLAKKLGHIDINVKARSSIAADAIEKKLLVKAEGTTVYFNKAYLIDLRNQEKFEEKVTVAIPDNIVSESENVEVSAISDVMGSTVNNLDKLLRMPYGCGEQNMLNFVPNIVITEYLSETKQLNDEVKSQALKYMEKGYQRELTYKRRDNSFSSFGNSDKNGSTWLTAFVVKSFMQAKPYITIDDNVISQSLNWLANLQKEDGSFPEVGQVFNKAMQGGSGNGTGLTAYVLSSFLEAKVRNIDVINNNLNSVIEKSLSYLERKLSSLKSDYDLVLATYVLHLANSNNKDDAFAKMEEKSKTVRDIKHWSIPLPSVNTSDPMSYYNRPRSVDVEMTSYALLTYVLRGEISNAVPIMRWLITKRNENGGFESTQDTVMGIQALAKFAAKLTPPEDSNLDVTVTYEGGHKNFAINKQTALILHREILPNTIRQVTLSSTGNGVGIVQITWSYNIMENISQRAFSILTNAIGKNEELEVEVCAEYIYEANGESNMAVMEIGLPSGYVLDRESLPSINETKMIKRVDTKEGDTIAVVYFDKIGNKVCTTVKANREFKIANVKPAMVVVYDYYDLVKKDKSFYEAPSTSVCELCETEECKRKENCA